MESHDIKIEICDLECMLFLSLFSFLLFLRMLLTITHNQIFVLVFQIENLFEWQEFWDLRFFHFNSNSG